MNGNEEVLYMEKDLSLHELLNSLLLWNVTVHWAMYQLGSVIELTRFVSIRKFAWKSARQNAHPCPQTVQFHVTSGPEIAKTLITNTGHTGL